VGLIIEEGRISRGSRTVPAGKARRSTRGSMTTSSYHRRNRALSGFQHEDQGRGRRSNTGATFKDGVTQSRKRQRRPPLVGDRGPGVRRPPADVHRHAFARSALPRGRTAEIAVDFLIDRQTVAPRDSARRDGNGINGSKNKRERERETEACEATE